jgi:hypothetical protein
VAGPRVAGRQNHPGSTAGPAPSAPGRDSAEKGTVRASRAPRRLARFVRMRQSQVLNEERPSNRSIPRSTPSHVSWITSSATAGSATYSDARRTRGAW